MTLSISSLRNLPPKQVLAWALQEKARRLKARQDLEAQQALGAASPRINEGTSLVLDRAHCFSDLYYRSARYKVYWGGRASGKSWAVAEALIRKALVMPIRVLCTREFQVTIKDSSHRILKDTITRLGLDAWFRVTVEGIRSHCGAEFIFKGLHNNEQGIKSTEAIDICWVEEAQTVSALSWRTLVPTIRKPGAEIWITYNLIEEEDATHQMFVVNERPNSIIHKVNYDANPYFPEVLREDMEHDKKVDYHLYEHIWLGMPLKISNAVVFSGKYRVADFDEAHLRECHTDGTLRYGLDFGFAQDPAALIRFFPVEKDVDGKRRLYITHEAYGTGVELDEMPEWMDSVPGVREWPIKADAARPETISYLRRKGFTVSAAEKWEGCVKDGITHLRGFDEIIIHPRCPNMAREARLYRYKVDKKQADEHGNPQVLPIIVDAHNHTWDAVRYGCDGYIQRGGAIGMWERLGKQQ